MKYLPWLGGLAAALLLVACGEKPQTAATLKADGRPWETAKTAYTAQGWTAGDKTGWEQQLRARSQGQNEYSRAPAKP
jgi:major membrane immunogen (membrane-anchored lipoprotein)